MSRSTHHAFADATALRVPTSTAGPSQSSSTLRQQSSHQSLHSTSSTASSRTRRQRDLFAPSRSKRGTGQVTPRVEDDVLADSESEPRQLRRTRRGSPTRTKVREEQDFVNRQADGSYLLGLGGFGEPSVPSVTWHEEDDEEAQHDAQFSQIARKYFTEGYAIENRRAKQAHEDFEETRVAMMARLRETTMQRLDETRWLYEATDRYQPGLP